MIYTLVVVNKADDMQLVDEDGDELEMTGEMREMFDQTDTLIRRMFHERDVADQLVGVIPLCAIDAYLYRMVQKHGDRFKLTPEQILKIGVNDEGKKFSKLKPATQEERVNTILSNQTFIHDMIKLSGFRRFETILHEFLNKNNTGKEIRINNLLDELKKHESIEACFGKLSVVSLVEKFPIDVLTLKCKILEPGFVDRTTEECKREMTNLIYSWLEPLKQTIENYLSTLHKIQKIDKDMYLNNVQEFFHEFNTLLEDFVRHQMINNQRIASYVYLYTKITEFLMRPFFIGFVMIEDYPESFINRMLALTDESIKTSPRTPRTSLCALCGIFKRLGVFDLQVVSTFLDKIIRFNQQILEILNLEIPQLLTTLTEVEGLKVDLSRFLRFLLIQKYSMKTWKEKELIEKQFFFGNFNEIYLQTYVSNLWMIRYGKTTTTMLPSVYIQGLTQEEIHSEDNVLELFYVKYEMRHNKLRLMMLDA